MADLACGTGGFLTSTLNRLSSQRKTSEDTKKYNTAVLVLKESISSSFSSYKSVSSRN